MVVDYTAKLSEEELVQHLITNIQNAYLDAMNAGNRILEVLEVPSATMEHIEVQYCYDPDYNRIFVEFELSDSIKVKGKSERIIKKIHSYLNTNFYKDTTVFPEIIAYDDDVNERYDSIQSLSPYTIGYWECLHGHYEFLYSHQVFMNNMAGLNIPTWSKEFLDAMDENFKTNYSTNYPKFLEEMVRIRTEYKISGDQPPEKKIEDFALKVKEIYDKYIHTLTIEEKDSYIQEYMEVKGDSEKMKEINQKYGIGEEPLWSKIPEIMEEYKAAYKEFFGVELHDFIQNTKRFFIVQA